MKTGAGGCMVCEFVSCSNGILLYGTIDGVLFPIPACVAIIIPIGDKAKEVPGLIRDCEKLALAPFDVTD